MLGANQRHLPIGHKLIIMPMVIEPQSTVSILFFQLERRQCNVLMSDHFLWNSDCHWNILVMWLRCRFLDTEVGGSTLAASVCCVLEQDTLSVLLQLALL